MIRRVLGIAGLIALTASGFTWAQTAQAPYPPSNLELRSAQYALRQQQLRQAERATQESRIRRLTGSGAAAGPDNVVNLAVGSATAGRIAVQAMIGAVVAAAFASATTEDAGLFAEISQDSVTSGDSGDSSGTPSTSTTSSTMSSTSTL